MTNMVDGLGTTKYTYSAAGQLLTEDGPFTSDTVTNVYSNRLRTGSGLQQPTGAWTNGFAYDITKRLTNVTSSAGAFGYLYEAGVFTHQPARITLPNTSYITNVFDADARLTATFLKNSGDTVLDSYSYIYNPANQRTNLTRADASAVAFKYDRIGQLTVADSSVPSEDRGYTYDKAWNLNWLTNNGAADLFQVNSLNELTNCFAFTNWFDANGNMTNTRGSHSLTYDDENRLTLISDDTYRSFHTTFAYDGLGRLRKRTEYTWFGSGPILAPGWRVASSVEYIYDGWRVIQERDGNNVPTVSYTRGNDLSGTMEGAGGIGGLLARSSGYSGGNFTTHNYYFADGNGNITCMLDSSPAKVASYRYDPFGNTISSSGTLASANIYRFSSKEIHVNSGMYYYGYRFYDPNLQRWINRDPLGDKGLRKILRERLRSTSYTSETMNLYQIAYNDTVRRLDPLGLFGGWGSSGGYGVPGSDISWQLNQGSNCIGELSKVIEIILGNSGMDGYPESDDDDSLQHCMTSCGLARGCGNALAAFLGSLKEFKDLIWGGTAAQSDADMTANEHGRKGTSCPTKSCEDYCNQTRNQYP